MKLEPKPFSRIGRHQKRHMVGNCIPSKNDNASASPLVAIVRPVTAPNDDETFEIHLLDRNIQERLIDTDDVRWGSAQANERA
jgi:hypothetical protein